MLLCKGQVTGVKVTSVRTNAQYKLFPAHMFVISYDPNMEKGAFACANTCKKKKKKNSSESVMKEREEKKVVEGVVVFDLLNSQDFPQLLKTLDPIYPQNLRSLCFHSGSFLSEPPIYGPCLIIGYVCCFNSLC